jgi:hypothetical protein
MLRMVLEVRYRKIKPLKFIAGCSSENLHLYWKVLIWVWVGNIENIW